MLNSRCLKLMGYCHGIENEKLKIKKKFVTELYIKFLCEHAYCS